MTKDRGDRRRAEGDRPLLAAVVMDGWVFASGQIAIDPHDRQRRLRRRRDPDPPRPRQPQGGPRRRPGRLGPSTASPRPPSSSRHERLRRHERRLRRCFKDPRARDRPGRASRRTSPSEIDLVARAGPQPSSGPPGPRALNARAKSSSPPPRRHRRAALPRLRPPRLDRRRPAPLSLAPLLPPDAVRAGEKGLTLRFLGGTRLRRWESFRRYYPHRIGDPPLAVRSAVAARSVPRAVRRLRNRDAVIEFSNGF